MDPAVRAAAEAARRLEAVGFTRVDESADFSAAKNHL